MSKCVNQVTLLGHVGRDPKTTALAGGGQVCTFSLATSRPTGQGKPEAVQWHTCVAWGGERSKLADLAQQLLVKGSRVLVTGELRYREWRAKDTDAARHLVAEVHLSDFVLLSGGARDAADAPSAPPAPPRAAARPARPTASTDTFDDFPDALESDQDDLPF